MRRGWLLVVVLAVASPVMGGQGLYVVTGAEPVQYRVNGAVQDVTPLGGGKWLVQVGTELAPLAPVAPEEEPPRPDRFVLRVPAGFRLPHSMVNSLPGREDPLERATAVLCWVQRSVRLDDGERAPQDARSVLRRGSGRCSGLANAAVAALRGAGIPARTVSGILVTQDGPVPHRWFEAWLGRVGWVASDPTLGLWVVTPRHLACAAPALGDVSVVVRSLVEDDLASLPLRGSWLCRPGAGARLTVNVRGMAMRGGKGRSRVILEGPGGERRVTAAAGAVDFTALPPGRWIVRLEVDGRSARELEVHLRDGDVRSVALPSDGEGRPS